MTTVGLMVGQTICFDLGSGPIIAIIRSINSENTLTYRYAQWYDFLWWLAKKPFVFVADVIKLAWRIVKGATL